MKPSETPTAEQLAAMTPVEVDTELSRLWDLKAQAEAKHLTLVTSLHEVVGDKARRVRGAGPIFSMSWEQVLEQAVIKTRAAHYTRAEREMGAEIDKVLMHWALTFQWLEGLAAEIEPYVNEYVRRGRWNRVFLAQSSDGHAHNGTECSTCHHGEERTRFAWLIQYSGKTEEEIIKAAGVRACTTCYKDAPTEDLNRPTVMFTEDETEAQRAREERAAVRAQRDTAKASKAITNPDGSPLRGRYGRIETEVTAVREAVDGLSGRYQRLRVLQLLEADPGLSPFFWEPERLLKSEEDGRKEAMPLVEAIAHKRDVTVEELLAELEPKAFAKAKRNGSGKDWVDNVKRNASFLLEERDAYLAQCEKEGREPWAVLSLRWPKEF